MAMVNMGTYATVNGVQEYTVTNKLAANGSATDESILIYSTGTIQVSPAAAIAVDFLRCNLFIKDPIPAAQWFNNQDASISYNADNSDRYSTASQINFEDCQVVFNGSSIAAIFLSDCINTRIFNAGSTMLTYTQEGANLNNMSLNNSNWEVNGQPSEAANIKLVNSSITNYLVPRLDFAYIDLTATGNNLTLNIGNGGNVSVYMWNFVQFDNTKINHLHVNNRYCDGVSASWKFKDRDNGTDVNGVLIINSSDKSGSMTELGRYTTNANGVLTGTYDSRFETTGANQVRDALFLFENYSDQAGSSYTNGGLSYDIVSIENRIEIRSYLHEAPVGYIIGDTYTNGQQGTVASNFTADNYQNFILNNELNITETNKATVLAYTSLDLGDPLKLFDRSRVEWCDNDGYAYINRVGQQLDLDNKNLILDASASSDYDAGGGTNIIAKVSEYTGGAIATTGVVLTSNGTLLNGGVFDCHVVYNSGASTTLTNLVCNDVLEFFQAGTYVLDGCTVNEVTNTSGGNVILQLTNGSTVTTNTGPNITLIQNVDVVNANLLDDTRVQLYNVTKAAEVDNSVVSGGGGYSVSVNLLSAAVDDGDTLRIRGVQTSGVTAQSEYEESGIVTTNGLTFIGSQSSELAYDSWGLDGSLITKFTADYVNDEVDISVGVGFQLSELGAWWQYNLTTESGIRDFFGGMSFVDEANILIHNATVNIFMDNITATNVHQTDNRRLYRDDLTRPVVDPTTGAGGIDIEWRSPVTIADSAQIHTDLTNIKANQVAINDGVKKSSLIIPHSSDIPNP